MKKTDLATFSAMITRTCETIGRKPISREGIQLYFTLLAEYPIEDIKRGLAAHLRDPSRGRYMPKPADIIAALMGDPEARASEAWAKVHEAITHTGAWESVVFDDPVIHAVIHDMGGWMDLCRCSAEDYRFREHAFLKRYKVYCGRDPGKYPKTLAGEFEITNRANGHEVEQPVMIGDPRRAMDVYEGGSDTPRIERTPFDRVARSIMDMTPEEESEHERTLSV